MFSTVGWRAELHERILPRLLFSRSPHSQHCASLCDPMGLLHFNSYTVWTRAFVCHCAVSAHC